MGLRSKIQQFLNSRNVGFALAFVGLLSGPQALISAEASNPPLDWKAIALILVGGCLGILIVLGIQIAVRNAQSVRIGWQLFLFGSIYFFSSGVSAVFLSLYQNSFGPPAMLCLAIGVGLFAGLKLIKRAALTFK